jgi:biopolymer transport protein ExbD
VGRERTCPKCRASIKVPTAEQAAKRRPVDDAHASSPHSLLGHSGGEHEEDLIDMTAMVDIVFFLLIFFMVTSMQALEAVINLPTPESTAASSNVQAIPDIANETNYVVVTIDTDDSVWIDGVDGEILSEQDLRAKLRAALKEGDYDGMMIKGSGDATHGKFVMVLDAGADAGVKELLFSVDQSEVAEGG